MAETKHGTERPAAEARRGEGRRKYTARVPIGVEKVLYLAATSPAFRRRLAEDRPAAIAAARVRLTDAERTTLLGVPARALDSMIDRIRPTEHGKRRFMKTIAAATVSLAASVASEGCTNDDDWSGGIGPDIPQPDDIAAVEDAGEDEADVTLPPDATEGIDAEIDPWDTAEVPVPDTAEDGIRPDGGE